MRRGGIVLIFAALAMGCGSRQAGDGTSTDVAELGFEAARCSEYLLNSAPAQRALSEAGGELVSGLAAVLDAQYVELQRRVFVLFHADDDTVEHRDRRTFLNNEVYADDGALVYVDERFYLRPDVAQLGVWATRNDPYCDDHAHATSIGGECDPQTWFARIPSVEGAELPCR